MIKIYSKISLIFLQQCFQFELDLNANQGQEVTNSSKPKITVQNKNHELDFEVLWKEYLRYKSNELNQANKNLKDSRRYNIQRPYETAQQKAAKRANKLLDSKHQQEVEKLAAEKLGRHEKKCPICEQPFKDVNEFMAHLSKCNVLESSEDEAIGNLEDMDNQVTEKRHDEDDQDKHGKEDPRSTDFDASPISDVNKLKVLNV